MRRRLRASRAAARRPSGTGSARWERGRGAAAGRGEECASGESGCQPPCGSQRRRRSSACLNLGRLRESYRPPHSDRRSAMLRKTLFAFALLAALPAQADDAATRPAYWGSPRPTAASAARRSPQVRENIDRIDRDLVRLMAERRHTWARPGGSRRTRPPSAIPPGRRRSSPGCAPTRGAGPRPDRRRKDLPRHDRRLRGFRARRVDGAAGAAGK